MAASCEPLATPPARPRALGAVRGAVGRVTPGPSETRRWPRAPR